MFFLMIHYVTIYVYIHIYICIQYTLQHLSRTSSHLAFANFTASQRYQVVDLATYTTVIVGYAESAGYEAENPGG